MQLCRLLIVAAAGEDCRTPSPDRSFPHEKATRPRAAGFEAERTMSIKSLLLASAAALVAVSGARAADAVVTAEPEPVEYVRICDAYGKGFYYIPGTETCLKVDGYVRIEVSGGDFLDDPEDSYDTLARFTLRTDSRNETEFGTLQAFTETQFNYRDGDFVDTTLNFAWIELAGFHIGKAETAFDYFSGYAGNVINDSVVPFGPFDTMLAWYEADFGGGFSGIISLEEGANEFDPTQFPDEVDPAIDGDEIVTYIPHVVVGAKYESTYFDINGVAAYDSNNEEFAGKVRVDIKPSETFYGFIMGGYKTDDSDVEERGVNFSDGTNYYGNWQGGDEDEVRGGDGFAVWAGLSYVFTPELTFNSQVAYDEGENFGVAAQLNWQPVPGLSIQPEVGYATNFDDNRFDDGGDEEDDAWSGVLRIQRTF
jgi:opacity protein-like surface antigen